MGRIDEEEKSLKALALHLNRYFYEGNKDRQIYSFDYLITFMNIIGFKKYSMENNEYLIKILRSWDFAGYIRLNENDKARFLEVLNPSFPGIGVDA